MAATPEGADTSAGAKFPGGECAREKYWHEKSAEERCIKLGEAVEYLTREVRELRQQAADFKVHFHADNRLFVPLETGTAVKEYESYFFRNPLGRESVR